MLISSDVIPDLGAVSSGSMYDFLGRFPTATVEVEDDGAVIDIDTPETMRMYAARAEALG